MHHCQCDRDIAETGALTGMTEELAAALDGSMDDLAYAALFCFAARFDAIGLLSFLEDPDGIDASWESP